MEKLVFEHSVHNYVSQEVLCVYNKTLKLKRCIFTVLQEEISVMKYRKGAKNLFMNQFI